MTDQVTDLTDEDIRTDLTADPKAQGDDGTDGGDGDDDGTDADDDGTDGGDADGTDA
jgi:hypothetical protein